MDKLPEWSKGTALSLDLARVSLSVVINAWVQTPHLSLFFIAVSDAPLSIFWAGASLVKQSALIGSGEHAVPIGEPLNLRGHSQRAGISALTVGLAFHTHNGHPSHVHSPSQSSIGINPRNLYTHT